jgi:phosphoribosylglycinamide formyltransferase 1
MSRAGAESEQIAPRPGTRPTTRLPIGVLISGAGTNLRAILEQAEAGLVDVDVRVVICNRDTAPGLAFARDRNIPTVVLPRQRFASRDERDAAIIEELEQHGVELVVLAGYDQILSDAFVQHFSFRAINLHPSLLPAFGGGMHGVRDALEWGAKVAGCTVHYLAAEFPAADEGPIILQRAVPIEEDDTEESLLERVHGAEHEILPLAVQLIAERRVRIEGRRVRILPPSLRVES